MTLRLASDALDDAISEDRHHDAQGAVLIIPDETSDLANDIATTIEYTDYAGRYSPSSIAASCLYVAGLVSEHRLPQYDVGALFDVSGITIREHYPHVAAVYLNVAGDRIEPQRRLSLRGIADMATGGTEGAA